jgi:hypothetical protein
MLVCTIHSANKKVQVPFWQFVNGIAAGEYHDYDIISMLNDGTNNHNRVNTYM